MTLCTTPYSSTSVGDVQLNNTITFFCKPTAICRARLSPVIIRLHLFMIDENSLKELSVLFDFMLI